MISPPFLPSPLRRRGARVLTALVFFAIPAFSAAAQYDSAATTAAAPSMHGLLQLWYRTGDLAAEHDTYRLRKIEISLNGQLSPRVRWRTTLDFAKLINIASAPPGADPGDITLDQRGKPLQDAAITFVYNRRLRFDVGQQLVPLTMEGLQPSAEVETIDRALLIADRARAGGYGHVRDIGVTIRGDTRYADYHLGSYNSLGDSQNGLDVNDQKSIAGRLSLRAPQIPGLRVGGSAGYESGPMEAQRRNRAGGEAEYRNSTVTIRAEAMAGQDGLFHRLGYYGLAAYKLTPSVQLVGRFDSWDPDRQRESALPDALQRQFIVGGNYFIDKNARLAINFVHNRFPNVPVASTNALALLAQASW